MVVFIDNIHRTAYESKRTKSKRIADQIQFFDKSVSARPILILVFQSYNHDTFITFTHTTNPGYVVTAS